MSRHVSSADVDECAQSDPAKGEFPRTLTISLEKGESAWNPATTQSKFWGPCTVEYVQYRDGGWDVRVTG